MPFESKRTFEVRRMWEGGPLRQWSNEPVKLPSWNRYESNSYDGFAGPYVCDNCQGPVVGLYRQKSGGKWFCKECHVKVRPYINPKPPKLDKRKAAK